MVTADRSERSRVGRRMKRGCLKRSYPFGVFCENTQEEQSRDCSQAEQADGVLPSRFSSQRQLDDGIDQQRDHHHDSGVFQLSDPSSRKHCIALE
ncbi:hypothetical protein DY000_02058333 [Brassica cretica]|uniref:Uncharacterized protein n=1 Tax=Brassica cretica TaxID=69181 RepID=A0ABQ7A4X7_BRACR|nr:hypothetical protein DY000_02058333 [Brassica cretica]